MSGSAGHAGTATSAADSVPPEFTNDPMSLAQAKLHINSILREINGGKEVRMDSACENFLLQYMVKFVEQVTADSLQYARHRGSDVLEDQDIKFCLKEDHGMDSL